MHPSYKALISLDKKENNPVVTFLIPDASGIKSAGWVLGRPGMDLDGS